MQIVFLNSFYKDLNKLKNKTVAQQLSRLIADIEKANDLSDLPELKKLKGHKHAYRIRIKSYRLGVFIEGNKIEFTRLLPRKDVYRYFP